MEESKQIIHVLMVSFGAQGHLNPMLTLGKHLQTKGDIHITLATNEYLRHRVLKNRHNPATTATTAAAASSDKLSSVCGIDFVFFSDGFDFEYDRKGNLDTYMDTLDKVGPINLYNLITSLSSNDQTTPKKFSCIIISPFVPWVADVAVKLGVPCAMLWIQPCTIFAIYHNFFNKVADFPTKEDPDKSVAIPGLPVLQTSDLPSFVLPSDPFGSVAKTCSEALQNVHKLRWVLANSFSELEKDVIDAMSKYVNIKAVGPLVPSSLLGQSSHHDGHNHQDQLMFSIWVPDDKCLVWLNQQKPNSVIYVSFGSLVVLTKEQIKIIGTALVKCKRPFIWVIKKAEYPVSEGAGEVPEELFDEIKDQGLVVPWCPQDKVLAHESLGCFVTHCGWNSTLESICAGVPVIGYPFWSDQPTNVKLVADVFGVGLRLWPNKEKLVEVEDVVKCIEEVMGGPRAAEIRAKALEWKRTARNAVVVGGSSDRSIKEFVDDIVGNFNSQRNEVISKETSSKES